MPHFFFWCRNVQNSFAPVLSAKDWVWARASTTSWSQEIFRWLNKTSLKDFISPEYIKLGWTGGRPDMFWASNIKKMLLSSNWWHIWHILVESKHCYHWIPAGISLPDSESSSAVCSGLISCSEHCSHLREFKLKLNSTRIQFTLSKSSAAQNANQSLPENIERTQNRYICTSLGAEPYSQNKTSVLVLQHGLDRLHSNLPSTSPTKHSWLDWTI